MSEKLTNGELREIERHKYFLSMDRGYDVGWETAKADWLANFADAWRAERQRHLLAMQREEISKHCWIESEKAHCDLGQQAKIDWIRKYAARFREWYEFEQDGA